MVVIRACTKWSTSQPLRLFVSGWEYAVDASYGVYGAIQKAYHLVRRKRWVRERLLKDPKAVVKQVRTRTAPSLLDRTLNGLFVWLLLFVLIIY